MATGVDGSLVCLESKKTKSWTKLFDCISDFDAEKLPFSSISARNSFMSKFILSTSHLSLNYFFFADEESFFEIQEEKRLQENIEQHQNEREKLASDLNSIKSRITYYLETNEKESEEYKLPIKKFNIDISGTERLMKEKTVFVENEERKFREFCLKKKEMFVFIEEHLWNQLAVKPLKVRSTSAPFFVENYPINLVAEKLGNELWLNEALQRENIIKITSKSCPWFDRTINLNRFKLPEIDFDEPTKQADRFVTAATKIYDRCLKARSTSSHLFIVPITVQSDVVNTEDDSQVNEHNIRVYVIKINFLNNFVVFQIYLFIYFQHNIVKLKKNFNLNFTKLRKTKSNEMDSLTTRHNRLRQIENDLVQLQQLIGKDEDSFPEVKDVHLLDDERIDIVFNSEEIDPDYQSRQMSENGNSEGETFVRSESIHKMYLDALDRMMGGVLEVSWEEEIKKNPKKPLCLLNLLPDSEYTDQDHQEVQLYESEMKRVTSERVIYIDKLFVERSKLIESIEIQTIQLNKCIQNVLQSKIHTAFAVNSEKLRILVASVDLLRFKLSCNEEHRIQ